MFTSYFRHYFGSLQISHLFCLIIHVYLIIIRTPSYFMSSYVSCHILNYAMPCHHYLSLSSSLGHHHIPCHHMCHATSSTMPSYSLWSYVVCHILNYATFLMYFTEFVLPSYPLVIPLSFMNTFDINENYTFDINDNYILKSPNTAFSHGYKFLS